MKHVNLQIYGKVQGVTYRFSAKIMAEELGLRGFVKNESDGSVYAEAEGEEEKLQQFIAWCRRGPQNAEVEEVQVQYSQHLKGFKTFESIHKNNVNFSH